VQLLDIRESTIMLKLILELCEIGYQLFSFFFYSWIRSFSSCSVDIVNSLGLMSVNHNFSEIFPKILTSMTGHRSLAEGYANEFLSAVLNCARNQSHHPVHDYLQREVITRLRIELHIGQLMLLFDLESINGREGHKCQSGRSRADQNHDTLR
jgi:hypothetical protein